jgi:lipopolysaccharide/colanic/teichoic acid biosynthesis glycosyltransferase
MTGGVKRGLDVAGALILLLLTSPFLAVAAAAVRVTMGRPVLFRQARTGLHGRVFTLLKLRTMTAADGGDLLHDGARLTPLGRWLRASSLDELPQLVNVLRGEMSLVGPRPLLPAYLARYTDEQARRHEVLPGLTGLTQVSGRNGLSWEEKFALDVAYVERRSLGLDAWILWRTLVTVVRREGVAASGHATMPEFLGSRPRPMEGSR